MESSDVEDKAPKASEGETEKVSEKEEDIKEEKNGEVKEDEEKKLEKGKKRGRKKGEAPGKQAGESGTRKSRKKGAVSVEPRATVDRPVRERKTVERFAASSPPESLPAKALSIKKGRGTQLKEIPNVAFKLSKRKTDESLRNLHNILFGKKTKAYHVKRNISQFSGYVWDDNEDKQRAKVKEKFDKCFKDRLLDFCDVLDIPVSKATVKKEELTTRLLEFLESPHPMRDVLLAEKEQSRAGKQLKRKAGRSKASGDIDSTSKKRKRNNEATDAKRSRAGSSKAEEKETEDQDESADSVDVSDEDEGEEMLEEESGPEENGSEDEVEAKEKNNRGKSNEKALTAKKGHGAKPSKNTSRSSVKKVSSEEDEDDDMKEEESAQEGSDQEESQSEEEEYNKKAESKKALSKKPSKKDVQPSPRKNLSPVKKASKTAKSEGSTKTSNEDKRKGQDSKSASVDDERKDRKNTTKSGATTSSKEQVKAGSKSKAKPTKEEMLAVVKDILKEVDFNTVTLADILKRLGKHFNTDLSERKLEVRKIIEEVINNMTDEEDSQDEAEVGGEHSGEDKDNNGD